MVAHSIADSIMEVAFGLVLPLALPGMPPPTSPLLQANVSRGFDGTLFGILWQGAVYNVVSNSSGLSLVPA